MHLTRSRQSLKEQNMYNACLLEGGGEEEGGDLKSAITRLLSQEINLFLCMYQFNTSNFL